MITVIVGVPEDKDGFVIGEDLLELFLIKRIGLR